MKYCMECGPKGQPNAKFCAGCGKSMSVGAVASKVVEDDDDVIEGKKFSLSASDFTVMGAEETITLIDVQQESKLGDVMRSKDRTMKGGREGVNSVLSDLSGRPDSRELGN